MAPRQRAALALCRLDRHRLLRSAIAFTGSCPFSDSTGSGAAAQRCAPVPIASAAPSAAVTRAPARRARRPATRCLPLDVRTLPDTSAPRPPRSPPGHGVCRPWRRWPLPSEPASALHRLHRQMLGRLLLEHCDEPQRRVRELDPRSAAPNLDDSWCLSCRSLRTRHPGAQLTP